MSIWFAGAALVGGIVAGKGAKDAAKTSAQGSVAVVTRSVWKKLSMVQNRK